MFLQKLAVICVTCILVYESFGQQVLPVPRNITDAYDKGTRSVNGTPGKNYWQNKASYDIDISFDPLSRQLSGTVAIQYTNNSTDTLQQIWFKLYPNLYMKGVLRNQSVEAADLTDGVTITRMLVNNRIQNLQQLIIEGTNMIVTVPETAPGTTIDFRITYTYTLNKQSHIRTGEIEPGADFIAYFFPRISVYDDMDGWNKYAYAGTQEFYNDFCYFKASITVPKDYIVWATGNLANCSDVLMPAYCERIQRAEQSDAVTNIIDTADLQRGNITANKLYNTWRFDATDVTDFVFAVSDHYIWKSSSLVVDTTTGRRTRVDAVFNPLHTDYEAVIDHARATVQHMSFDFPGWPFPYPHETVFDGLDQMEYPMMVNDNPVETVEDEIELTDHEIFHTMFPFYMGINETKYAWMDEGWATIAEWLISPMIDSSIVDEYGVMPYELTAGKEVDVPIVTLSTLQTGTAYFLNAYPKPAFGYLYVKDLLGNDLFYKALHYYIQQWHGKHPMPYDFFNCMNTGSGKNLNWFWKRWYFDDGEPDLAISKVTHAGSSYKAVVISKGSKPVPVDLTIHFADGTTELIHRTISVWEKGNSTVILSFTVKKPVTKLTLGSTYVPDTNKADNEYKVK